MQSSANGIRMKNSMQPVWRLQGETGIIDLKQIGLTAYGIARQISGTTDPSDKKFRQVCHRWQRWQNNEGLKTLRLMEEDLLPLGYRLTIEPIKGRKD
jgi:hypothetical protein